MGRPALGALLIILPVTLGIRAAGPGEGILDSKRLVTDAASNLADDGWSVRPVKHHLFGQLIEGARGDCRILVHFASPDGVTAEKFRALAQPVGPVAYQYRGATTREFPRLAPILSAHFQRYAWSFHLALPTAPPVAMARSPECGAQTPNFAGLRQHLQVAPDAVRPGEKFTPPVTLSSASANR